MPNLADLMGTRPALLLDGATGTNLFEMGLADGQAHELWNIGQPEKIKRLHQMFIEVDSDAILTNSFGGNARRLALHQAADQVHKLNLGAENLARDCAESAGRPMLVFGSVGPTGETCLRP
ncbi:MAG: homocysteine S-methyltransferase family protein [Alphaproteobacteria bacterium]|nr:homocysteine S-methyltransferase family protein [Alphaproteobacteria bacterium]